MIFDCLLWRWNTTYLFLLFGIVLAAKDGLLGKIGYNTKSN